MLLWGDCYCTERNPPPSEGPAATPMPTKSETEEWAVRLLVDHLARRDQAIEVVGRPDQVTSAVAAPDFEVRRVADGQTIAVEVTQLWRSQRDWVILEALVEAMDPLLRPFVEDKVSGRLWVDIRMTDRLARRDIPGIAAQASSQTVEWLRQGGVGDRVRVHGPNPVIRVKLDPDEPPMVAFWTGTPLAGGATVADITRPWVNELLMSKGTQARAYKETWLLIIDNMVVDGHQVEIALKERRVDIPANWRRIFYLPGLGRTLEELSW